jgi:hypothetical protein
MRTEAADSTSIRMIKAGAALAGVGMMIAATGMALVAAAATRGAMVWAKQRDISPGALAAARLEQARHASIAGMHAWREHAGAGAGMNGPRGRE